MREQMTRMINKRNRGRKGFTLIELLVVILIIAILAAMIVPKIVGKQDDAKVAKAMSDISTLSNEMERYRLDVSRYPTQEEGLEALRTAPADATGWGGPYLGRGLPADPWGQPYIYEFPGPYGDDSFLVYSSGPDGQPNTDDDIYVDQG